MRKIALATAVLIMIAGCTKRDPILPGVRTAIFKEATPNIIGGEIAGLTDGAVVMDNENCPYTQNSSNVISNGDKKIFSGFPTSNSVKSNQRPVCAGKYVIAGLTTGELVKINPSNRHVEWIADIFSPSNMTGGASVLDIVAPIIIDGNAVYAGGMGEAFCRINLNNGKKQWCAPISVASPFVITGPAAFVMGANGTLYALRTTDGAIYWQYDTGKCNQIKYEKQVITACKTKLNAATGQKI